MRRWWMSTSLVLLSACSAESSENCATIATQTVPSVRADLAAYLKCGAYTAFAKESAPHATVSAHGSMAQVYLNEALDGSLTAGNASHPMGAAAVKELYESDGTTLRGWSVMVKVSTSAGDGNDWYWLENFSTTDFSSPIGDATGASVCVGCHSAGTDHALTMHPLQ